MFFIYIKKTYYIYIIIITKKMSSGRMQLASVGVQDTYLTGNPEITYFLKRFKRHTRFALETFDCGIDGSSGTNSDGNYSFGGRYRCTIPRKGDIIRSMFLRIELPALPNSDNTFNVGYTDSIGHAIIEYADLIIGGRTIERITGEYMEIYSSFCVSESQQTAVTMLVGKTNTKTGLGPASTSNVITDKFYGTYPRTFIVPLPFYFHTYDSLGIPLSALTRHEVEVEIKLRDLKNLYVQPSTTSNIVSSSNIVGSILQLSMPVEFVQLSDEENEYIANRSIDYVISQVQLSRFVINKNETKSSVLLGFVNPVKELFIVIQNQDIVTTGKNDWFNFKNSQNSTFPKYEQLDSLELYFNGEPKLTSDVATSLYLRYVHPIQFHTRVPEERAVYNYCFAIDPESHVPTGQVNMSRILNKLLKITTTSNTKDRDVRIYAVCHNILRINSGLAGLLFTGSTTSL